MQIGIRKAELTFLSQELAEESQGADLVMAMAAESSSIVTELSCVHGQPMQAQGVWVMKKRSGLTLSF